MLADEAVTLARQCAIAEVIADALIARRYVLWAPGHSGELLELSDELLELRRVVTAPGAGVPGALRPEVHVPGTRLLDRATDEVADVASLATRLRSAWDYGYVTLHDAMLAAFAQGRFAEAAPRSTSCSRRPRGTGWAT